VQSPCVPGLARIASGTVCYYLEDGLGSVVGLADANQNTTDTFRYDAWGNLLQHQGTTATAYQWVGEKGYYLNPDAGLYLLGLRHYTPTMGRFLTRDPIGFGFGDANLYRYVDNNPIRRIDPAGLKCVDKDFCEKQYQSCIKSADLLAYGCIAACTSLAFGGVAGCLASGPFFPACAALVIAAQVACEAGCILVGNSGRETCQREYDKCVHESKKD